MPLDPDTAQQIARAEKEDWRPLWEAAGKARVAEALCRSQDSLVWDPAWGQPKMEAARRWLAERLQKDEAEKRDTRMRANAALAISIAALGVAGLKAFAM